MPKTATPTSSDRLKFFLALNPVPASRPRVSKWGTYYAKTYATWMKDAAELLKAWPHPTINGPVSVWIECVVAKPRTSKLSYPRGDIDNYLKAPLDALTKAKAWGDDNEVLCVIANKRFAAKGEDPGIHIEILERIHA